MSHEGGQAAKEARDFFATHPIEDSVARALESEGLPGTWSHCGKAADHPPHRHTVVFQEGPYDNVLCRGTPGDPGGDAPLGRMVYE